MWEQNGYKNTRTYAEGVEKSQTIQCFSAWGPLCHITTWDICAGIKLSQRKAPSQTITQTSSSTHIVAVLLFRSTCLHTQFAHWCCKGQQNYALSPSNNTFAGSAQQELSMALFIFSPSVGSKNYDFSSPHKLDCNIRCQLIYRGRTSWITWMTKADRRIPISSAVFEAEILFQKQ